MPGLMLGIDLCDDYSQISYFNTQVMDAASVGITDEENSCLIPSVVCKQRGKDAWFIGEEAYVCALRGEGTMVDKPIKMLSKSGTATIEGVKYTAENIDRVIHKHLSDLTEEELSLQRFEIIQDLLITNHDLPDQSYVDALCDMIYTKLYEN